METVLTVLNFLYLPPLTVLPGSTLFTPILTYFSLPSYLSSLGSPSALCFCHKWQHQCHANIIVHGDPVCHHSNRDDVQSWTLLQSYLHLELLGDACSIPFHCPITSNMSCTTPTYFSAIPDLLSHKVGNAHFCSLFCFCCSFPQTQCMVHQCNCSGVATALHTCCPINSHQPLHSHRWIFIFSFSLFYIGYLGNSSSCRSYGCIFNVLLQIKMIIFP